MARRTAQVRITDDNRDRGKHFVLTEMDSEQAEDWALRALLALTNAGAELPDEVMTSGMAGFAQMGVQALAGLKHPDVKPLLDEMFRCIEIIPDPTRPSVIRPLVKDDIEEVMTRVRLRKEILGLHVDFSKAGVPSTSNGTTTSAPLAAGVVTRTSPGPLA